MQLLLHQSASEQEYSARLLTMWMMKSVTPQKAQRRTQKAQDSWKAALNHK
jgi:hypothetical protein